MLKLFWIWPVGAPLSSPCVLLTDLHHSFRHFIACWYIKIFHLVFFLPCWSQLFVQGALVSFSGGNSVTETKVWGLGVIIAPVYHCFQASQCAELGSRSLCVPHTSSVCFCTCAFTYIRNREFIPVPPDLIPHHRVCPGLPPFLFYNSLL